MQLLIEKIRQLDINWNERPLTYEDIYGLCERFAIMVDEVPLETAGFYYRMLGQDFIAVNSKLTGQQKLAVLFHEFAHFLFHTSDSATAVGFHRVGRRTRQEREADMFAICALLPRPLIEDRSPHDLINDGHPAEMVSERFAIYRRYGI